MPEYILPDTKRDLSDPFLRGFIEALFFTNQADGSDLLRVEEAAATVNQGSGDANGFYIVTVKTEFGPDDLADETFERIKTECAEFAEKVGGLIADREEEAGRDFVYTRDRHGCGFWDGDWRGGQTYPGDSGDADGNGWKPARYDNTAELFLVETARSFGETNAYVGDDGKIYM